MSKKNKLDTTFIALFIWLAGFLMSILGGHELATTLQCGSEPATMACAELAQHGPTGSHYLRLTDFEPDLQGSLEWSDQGGRIERVEVPLLVKDSEQPARVIVRDYQPGSWADVEARLSAGELTALVVGHGVLNKQDAAMFASHNPGMNPAACWIISIDKVPGNPAILCGVVAAGVGLFSLSIVLFVLRRPVRGRDMLIAMSPLVTLVDAMHSLADWLPLPSRFIRAVFLLPAGIALASYGGYRYWLDATSPHAAVGMDAAFLPIILLDLGAAMVAVGFAYLWFDQPQSEATALPQEVGLTTGITSPGT